MICVAVAIVEIIIVVVAAIARVVQVEFVVVCFVGVVGFVEFVVGVRSGYKQIRIHKKSLPRLFQMLHPHLKTEV